MSAILVNFIHIFCCCCCHLYWILLILIDNDNNFVCAKGLHVFHLVIAYKINFVSKLISR